MNEDRFLEEVSVILEDEIDKKDVCGKCAVSFVC